MRWPRLLISGTEQGLDGYRPLAPDKRRRIWLDPLRLWLGLAENETTCYDESNRSLGDYCTLDNAPAAEQRADDKARSADEAEARLRALEAELLRVRGEWATSKRTLVLITYSICYTCLNE